MKTRTLISGLLPLLVALAVPAYAGQRHHDGNRFEQRLDRQEQRVRHGVRTGKLTHKEAKKLKKQQRGIARLEQRFERDGHLDRRERRVLNNRLDRASDRIARFKHNDNYRYRADRAWYRQGPGHRSHGYVVSPRYYAVDDDPRWALRFSLSDTW